jgi:low temperature requirement protein LtrA
VAEREQRVTPLELFFDLVFVFGLTQVTNFMSADPTWGGVGRGLLILAALWWAWTGYAWLTNTLEPEEGPVRAAMVAAMAAMLVAALAVPEAFDEHGVLFAVAFLIVRLLHLQLYAIAGKQDPDLLGAVLRLVPPAVIASGLLIVAGFLDGRTQATLWAVALAVDYLGVLIGRGRGWRVSPAHFAERHGLIVIIALGESIISIGIGAAGVSLTPGIVTAAILGIVAIAALWWAYFDVYAVMSQRQLAATSGAARARLARDHYSYLHMPMIAGIVLFALGLKKTIEHVGDPLETVPAVALCGGVALYFLTHVVMRIRSVHTLRRAAAAGQFEQDPLRRETPGWFGVGRPTATIAALALIPAALELSALTALALVTAVCSALIVYDVVHYREERTQVREARP